LQHEVWARSSVGLERRLVTPKVAGSSPVEPVIPEQETKQKKAAKNPESTYENQHRSNAVAPSSEKQAGSLKEGKLPSEHAIFHATPAPTLPADLARVVAAWPMLPKTLKKALLAMIASVGA
jgi:hypothetical protein